MKDTAIVIGIVLGLLAIPFTSIYLSRVECEEKGGIYSKNVCLGVDK